MSEENENKSFVHFTEKEWVEFLSHRIPPEKEAEFSRLSKQNDFSKEALEGIESIPNRAQVLSTINQINGKIKQRAGKSGGYMMKSNNTNYIQIGAIAAVLVLLIGIGSAVMYFINQRSNTQVAAVTAESIENPESVLPPDVASDAVVSGPDTTTTLSTASVDTTKINITPTTTPPPPAALTAAPKATVAAAPNQALAAKQTPPAKTKNLSEVSQAKETTPAAKRSPAGYTTAADMESGAAPAAANSPTLSQVIAEKKVAVPREDQNSSISQYQKGIDEMNKGNQDEALKNFDNVINQNSGFKVDAKWNKAQILIKKGENKKASKILKELAENENPYKNKAKELLKTLE